MADTITPEMSLDVPSIGVSPGPQWASTINADLGLVDAHDHSEGKGAPVTPAGLNVNNTLSFNGFSLIGLSDIGMSATTISRTWAPCTLLVSGGNAWFVDGNQNKIQLTANYQPATTIALLSGGATEVVSAASVVMSSDAYGMVQINSSAGAFAITLPTATRNAGRVFTIKDSGSAATHAVTIACYGSETIDGSSTLSISSNYQVARLYSDGTGWWRLL